MQASSWNSLGFEHPFCEGRIWTWKCSHEILALYWVLSGVEIGQTDFWNAGQSLLARNCLNKTFKVLNNKILHHSTRVFWRARTCPFSLPLCEPWDRCPATMATAVYNILHISCIWYLWRHERMDQRWRGPPFSFCRLHHLLKRRCTWAFVDQTSCC